MLEPISIRPDVIRVFLLCAFSAGVAVLWTPFLSNFLYKHKLWRKTARTKAIDGKSAEVFHQLHKEKEVGTPRMGGLLIWVTTLFITGFFALLGAILPGMDKLNFLSRSQTWLPLFALVSASLLGLGDDVLQVLEKGKHKEQGGGICFTRRLAIVLAIGMIGAWWFYFKLGWSALHIPGNGNIEIGLWYLPLFVITVVACWAGGIIDGIDGLSGGIFGIIFGAFSIIAFSRGQYDLSAFCAVIAGSTIAFLWFNIPPARFYMSETGTIGLTATLAVVAFLTDSVLVLPIIALPLVVEVGSVIIQLASKKIRGKKVFLSSPIHHHLEAIGWSREKITMRFWILGLVSAIIGVSIRLLG